MPWKPDDAMKHTKMADTAHKRAMWAMIANRSLDKFGDEGRAIRSANAVMDRLRRADKGK